MCGCVLLFVRGVSTSRMSEAIQAAANKSSAAAGFISPASAGRTRRRHGQSTAAKRTRRAAIEASKRARDRQRKSRRLSRHETYLEALKPNKGNKSSVLKMRMLLHMLVSLVANRGFSIPSAISETAELMSTNRQNLLQTYHHYREFEEVRVGEDKRAGRVILSQQKFPRTLYGALDRAIDTDILKQKKTFTAQTVAELIKSKWNFTLRRRYVQVVLNRLGYKYGRLRKLYRKAASQRCRKDKFIVEYAAVRQLELKGD